MAKRILRLTNTEALVKIDGAPGVTTINLATDLKLPTEEVSTPAVNITMLQVSGKPGCTASVVRNNEDLYDLQSGSAECIDFLSLGGASDSTNNTSNIDVVIAGAEGQLILKLRKVSGYKTKLQPDTYGPYDNPESTTS